ncbi:hypothetical protein FXV91_14265 [Methanosarcina sp. DH2]|uniref:hypothetical protein n=1 Tax=Methanosarcina sp. DH2 TaxID=2605639 RepID=UPI001E5E500B|nr:hypothetical protein [Methanosarcina sp. DH2]MCC4771284.1 hypothetical protein [Methanosarcina sp. DH2]
MEGYLKLKEQSSGNTRARGRVDMEETDTHYIFTVHIWTKVSGRLETGNGTATFIMFGEGDNVVSTLIVGEHASTDALKTSDEDHNSQERQYRKAYYDTNVYSEMLIVNARQISNTPNNPAEVLVWLHDVGGAGLRELRAQALKEGKGAIREGENFIIRVLK